MADTSKRPLESGSDGALVEVKRARTEELAVRKGPAVPEVSVRPQHACPPLPPPRDARPLTPRLPPLLPQGPKRTSALAAPIMLLTGHGDQVFTLKFSPEGDVIASGSHDKCIFLWRTYGECENFSVLKGVPLAVLVACGPLAPACLQAPGAPPSLTHPPCTLVGHKNAVLELHWTPDGERIISCSPDKTARAWDVETGLQIKKMGEHTDIVNSCCPLRRGPPLVVTGSDDGTAKVCRAADVCGESATPTAGQASLSLPCAYLLAAVGPAQQAVDPDLHGEVPDIERSFRGRGRPGVQGSLAARAGASGTVARVTALCKHARRSIPGASTTWCGCGTCVGRRSSWCWPATATRSPACGSRPTGRTC